MNTETINLRESIPFGVYKTSNINSRFSTFHLPVTFEVIKCEKRPDIVGKTFDVVSISMNEMILNERKQDKYNFDDIHFYSDKIEGIFMFDKKNISLDSLIKELKYKEATAEFSGLAFTKLKNGRYLGDYFADSLIGFFKQNENNFFMIDQCVVEKNKDYIFQFPKRADDREELTNYIKQNHPQIYNNLDEIFFEPVENTAKATNKTTQRPT